MSQSLRQPRDHFAAFVDFVLWRRLPAAVALWRRSPWLKAQWRRCALLVRWTFTLQLHVHARYWVRARRLRRAKPVPVARALTGTGNPPVSLRDGQDAFRTHDRSKGRRVVLVVDRFVPRPDRDAGSRTMMGFMRVLVQAGIAVKFWPHDGRYSKGYTESLQDLGIEVFHGPSRVPFSTWIRGCGHAVDCVLLSHPEVAEAFIGPIRRHSDARILYYGHHLHFDRMRQQGKVMLDQRLLRAADRMEVRERSIWQQADLSLYPSQEEADIAYALRPDCGFRAVVPYGFENFPQPRTVPLGLEIILVGGFGQSLSQDAACWFATEVFPLIRQQCPGASLSVIGSNPARSVRALASDGISIRPDVTDAELQAAYGRARAAVVPLRCGAGVKLKVIEALRAGVPLVTTPVGAQGLPGIWQVVPVESDPVRFAAAVVSLLRDDAEWCRRSAAQAAFAQQRFSLEAMSASLLTALTPPVPVLRQQTWIFHQNPAAFAMATSG